MSVSHNPEADEMEPKRINPILRKPTRTRPSRYSRHPWRLVECLETGLVYLENPPAYSELNQEFAWEKTQAEEKVRRTHEEPISSFVGAAVRQAHRTHRAAPKLEREALHLLAANGRSEPPLRVLEVGCASGQKVRSIAHRMRQEHGVRVVPIGIEISDALARCAQANLAEYGGYAIHAPALEGLQQIEDGSIDLIILSSYLEHEIFPLEALRSCGRKLVAGGHIIIKVPNFASLNRKVRQRRWCGFRYPDHVNYFSPATLKLLVHRAGLAVARMNLIDRLPTNDNMWLIARQP